MKPRMGEAQRISSSAMRDRCIMIMAQAATNSMAKSRSDTASRELRLGRSKPSSRAVNSRSTGKLVPASAAEPSGIRSEERRVGKERRCGGQPDDDEKDIDETD